MSLWPLTLHTFDLSKTERRSLQLSKKTSSQGETLTVRSRGVFRSARTNFETGRNMTGFGPTEIFTHQWISTTGPSKFRCHLLCQNGAFWMSLLMMFFLSYKIQLIARMLQLLKLYTALQVHIGYIQLSFLSSKQKLFGPISSLSLNNNSLEMMLPSTKPIEHTSSKRGKRGKLAKLTWHENLRKVAGVRFLHGVKGITEHRSVDTDIWSSNSKRRSVSRVSQSHDSTKPEASKLTLLWSLVHLERNVEAKNSRCHM